MNSKSGQPRGNKRDPKDKVLHTRIPEQLEQQLKDHAENMGLSVSSIVRNVLINTFNLVEDVVTDSAKIAFGATRSMSKPKSQDHSSADDPTETEKPMKAQHPESHIYGWQTLTLNMNAVCHQCNDILPKGSAAAMGLPLTHPPVFLCQSCLTQLQSEVTQNE